MSLSTGEGFRYTISTVRFIDSDGDPGSFRLQSIKKTKNLELWYGTRSTKEERVPPNISIVVYNPLNGIVKVGSDESVIKALCYIDDHATVMHKVKAMCGLARAQFRIDSPDQSMQQPLQPSIQLPFSDEFLKPLEARDLNDNDGGRLDTVPTGPQNTDYIRQLFSLVRSQVTADVYQKITVYVKKVKESTLANTDKRKKIMAGLIE
jgi:hypothetical protein